MAVDEAGYPKPPIWAKLIVLVFTAFDKAVWLWGRVRRDKRIQRRRRPSRPGVIPKTPQSPSYPPPPGCDSQK
jgi:hypothetical protein